jgi:hypothetical protein
MSETVSEAARGTPTRTKRTLGLLAAIALAPAVIAALVYYVFPREARTNYGELLPTRAAPMVSGTLADGRAFTLADLKGKWAMVIGAGGACAPSCEKALYAMRQARTIQNAEAERVARVWFVTDGATPVAALLAQYPGMIVARGDASVAEALAAGENRIVLIDPRGNLVLAWPQDPDIKALARDLTKLLRVSQIG